MKVALPVWNDRVAPVFDVATRMRILEVRGGAVAARSEHQVGDDNLISTLWKLGVDVVICGAITRQLEAGLWAAGIEVIPEICGPVDRVMNAFLHGAIFDEALLSPCHPHRTLGVDPTR